MWGYVGEEWKGGEGVLGHFKQFLMYERALVVPDRTQKYCLANAQHDVRVIKDFFLFLKEPFSQFFFLQEHFCLPVQKRCVFIDAFKATTKTKVTAHAPRPNFRYTSTQNSVPVDYF